MEFTLVMKQKSIECHDGRDKGSRLIAQGDGMKFYIVGAWDKKRAGAICNVIANKAIEVVGTARNVKIVHGATQETKVHPAQLKLL